MVAIDITRKIGPAPLWAYGAGAAAIAWAFYLYKKHQNGGAVAASTEDGTTVGYDTGSDAGFLDDLGSGTGAGGGSGGTSTVPVITSPTTNLQWFSVASKYLVGFGYDGSAVAEALNRYLTGLARTPAQKSLVDQAIARFEQPPEGVPLVEDGQDNPTPNPEPTSTIPGLSAPESLTLNGIDSNGGFAHLSWAMVEGAEGYVVECVGGRNAGQAVSNGPTYNYWFGGGTATFRVRATKGAVKSNWSNSVVATLPG
jgi:hypothetical protein